MTKTSPQLEGFARPNSAGEVVEPVRYRLAVGTGRRGFHRLVACAADIAAVCQDRIDDERMLRIVGPGAEAERARVEQHVAAANRPAHAIDVLIQDRCPLHERVAAHGDLRFTVSVDRDAGVAVEAQPESVEPCAGLHEDVVLEQAISAVHPHVDAGIGVDHADAAEQSRVADPFRAIQIRSDS